MRVQLYMIFQICLKHAALARLQEVQTKKEYLTDASVFFTNSGMSF